MSPEPAPAAAEADTGHDYDGIHELDNPLPSWWLTTLYGAIVFAFGYWLYYQVFGGVGLLGQLERDEAEAVTRAAATAPVTDELLLTLASDPATSEKARALFVQQCAQCHKPDGTGNIGPNLTDDFWIHGDRPTEIYATIAKGVPPKGMPSWEPLLGGEKVKWLAGYVAGSLKGKHLPGKAPEGKKVE